MLIRAKFEKMQAVKYISHLELMTLFRRAFKRAELPLAYSKGFNPHVLLSLGQPLKVGMIGKEEYFDLSLREEMETDKFLSLANEQLPVGLKILEARSIPENTKSLMATIDTADYIFKMDFNSTNITEGEMLAKFLAENEIIVLRKRRKKKDIEIDIRPLIYNAEIVEKARWKFRVQSGSSGNLRPDEISRALAAYFEEIDFVPVVNIWREGLYVHKDKSFYSPLDDIVLGR